MPAYHIAAVAFATETDVKWIDNLLSHNSVVGVARGERGLTRKIPAETAVVIAITRQLVAALGLRVERALQLAERIAENNHGIDAGNGVQLSIDVSRMRERVESRLTEASEVTVQPKRGRPSRRIAAPLGDG